MKSLFGILSLAALLQQTPAAPQEQKLVLNVTDARGRYVLNLGPEHFSVEEDGVRQEILTFLQYSEEPVSLGILIDKSTSMRLPLYVEGRAPAPAALLAASRFARAMVRLMRAGDEFMLMTFDEKLQVRQNFTEDRGRIEQQLTRLNEVGGATHLYDSVLEALEDEEGQI